MFESKHNPSEVLAGPFDYALHNETFVNYCEVIVTEDGNTIYAVPSHLMALEKLYVEEKGSSPAVDCPREFYADYLGWLSEELKACVVYTNFFGKVYNDKQRRELRRLQMHGCCNFGKQLKMLTGGVK